MAHVLPDREIKKLLGKAIIGGSEDCIRINSYEVRLGHCARFDSTGEEFEIPDGHYLEIEPGDFVTVESLEKFDFSIQTLQSIGVLSGLFALITPTTTMMREGFLFASTKVDPGYHGKLNWGIRNSSIKTVKLRQGERLFKLTLMELSDEEKPEKLYGDSSIDHYQGTSGIKPSARLLPVDIPEKLVVRRSQRKMDPIKQLTQAGYPFNHIGTELISIQGQFKIVSEDVATLTNGMTNLTTKLNSLVDEVEGKVRAAFGEQFSLYFDSKMMRVYGSVAAIVTLGLGAYKLLVETVPSKTQIYVLFCAGIVILLGTLLLTSKQDSSSTK
ncbi:MAG TPA: hypothetical protein VJO35_15510 [Terriglobales bacterium]|nr:hypothetical protein [Terriglobales bacterium]